MCVCVCVCLNLPSMQSKVLSKTTCTQYRLCCFLFNYRTEFRLDESGDVTWKVSDDAEPMLFFTCETYEVCGFGSIDLMHATFFNFHCWWYDLRPVALI